MPPPTTAQEPMELVTVRQEVSATSPRGQSTPLPALELGAVLPADVPASSGQPEPVAMVASSQRKAVEAETPCSAMAASQKVVAQAPPPPAVEPGA